MKIYTPIYGDIPAETRDIVQANVDNYGLEVVRLEDITGLDGVELAEAYTIAKDQWMCKTAMESTEPVFVIDHDCRLLKPLDEFADRLPALPYWPLPEDGMSADPQPDTFIFGATPAFAEWMVAEADRKCRGGVMQYCWPRKVLRDVEGITRIGPEYYDHGCYTVHKRRELKRARKDRRNGRTVKHG